MWSSCFLLAVLKADNIQNHNQEDVKNSTTNTSLCCIIIELQLCSSSSFLPAEVLLISKEHKNFLRGHDLSSYWHHIGFVIMKKKLNFCFDRTSILLSFSWASVNNHMVLQSHCYCVQALGLYIYLHRRALKTCTQRSLTFSRLTQVYERSRW